MQSAEDSSAETNQNTTDEIDLMPEDYSTSESIVLAPESEEEILPEEDEDDEDEIEEELDEESDDEEESEPVAKKQWGKKDK